MGEILSAIGISVVLGAGVGAIVCATCTSEKFTAVKLSMISAALACLIGMGFLSMLRPTLGDVEAKSAESYDRGYTEGYAAGYEEGIDSGYQSAIEDIEYEYGISID